MLRRLLFFVLAGWIVLPLYAQEADTTSVVAADSLQLPSLEDTLVADSVDTPERRLVGPPLGFGTPEPGTPVGEVLPVLRPVLDATGILADVAGSFVYDFGMAGWPNGWSPDGLDPGRVALLLNGLPLNDLATGRPRYDLLPLSLLVPLRLQTGRYGAPAAVSAQLRDFVSAKPLTEMRYRTSNIGLQAVTVVHVQQRHWNLFGREGRANLLFGYAGEGAKGEYDGSRLRRARQLYSRLRYTQEGWSLDINNLYNRRRVGAQGGVQPFSGGDYNSIYQRLGATVEDPNARRETIRNDLSVTARRRVLPGASDPLTVTGYWTAETFGYRNTGDTLRTRMSRLGFRIRQDTPFLGGLQLRLEGWRDRVRSGNALPRRSGLVRTFLYAAARDTLRLSGLQAVVEAGLNRHDLVTFPSALLHLKGRLGLLQFFSEASHTGQLVSWVDRYGYGASVHPVNQQPDGRITQGRLGLGLHLGAFDLTAFGFGQEISRPLDFYATADADTVFAVVSTTPHRRAGLGVDLGWRRGAKRGLYFTLQPTLYRFLNPDASPEHGRAAAALPEAFVRGRFGARFVLFLNDLDLDIYLQARGWTEMRSRVLHTPTGLLALPVQSAPLFAPSGTLDVYAEAGVRGATLFLSYENLLSGTNLLIGNLLVPDYPLPERRFRFGVFWPIFD